ncbi:hypothetical protein ACT3CD_13510 [Geofilum sp. OHC36d9]|uniref:hypothetical protein n=1 Tax=Geofilum sp. OHC36d9 TaxID=3458413 RepID=UPI004034579E
MASTSETGHSKNVANFQKLTTYVTGLGTEYNPSKENIQLPSLNELLAAANEAINNVNAAESTYKHAVSTRYAAFKPMKKLITRVNSALKASGASQQVIDSAMTLVRKLQGRRSTPKMTEEEKMAAQEKGLDVNEISVSQMSYDSRLDNFDKLIKLLETTPQYAPNETELTTDSLSALYNNLYTNNTLVIDATVALSNARINRDTTLYAPDSGLVDISLDVKMYVKSVFGSTAPQYKAISRLNFRDQS